MAGNQPFVSLLDSLQEIRSEICPDDAPCSPVIHEVTTLIYNNPGCSQLRGTNIVETVSIFVHPTTARSSCPA